MRDLDQIILTRHSNASAFELFAYEEESVDDILELSKILSAPECSFADLLEINQNELPPESRLSDIQVSDLLCKLSDALMVFQCYLDFPSKISCRMKYDILRSYWNEPQLICNHSVNTIDFCDYDQDHCLYGAENCQCKNFESLG